MKLSLGARALFAFIGLAAAAMPATASDRLACKIEIVRNPAGLELLALVSAPQPISGQYRLQVTMMAQHGNSTMNHGGTFTAGPGAPQVVGRFSLAGGGQYMAQLQVTADGHTIDCNERIGGAM